MRFPIRPSSTPFEVALRRLRDGRVGESAYGRRIALALTIPAFDDPVARDVRCSPSGELYVVRTVWQRALDVPAVRRSGQASPLDLLPRILAEPRPTLWSTTVRVDRDALMPLLDAVRAATIPCHPERGHPSIAATVYELSFGENLDETRYRWSGEPPSGWHPLANFATRLIRLVDLPASAASR